MIDQLHELVAKHFGAGELRFTKFCQRIAGPETKVLYFVTRDRAPLCILKVMRSASYNDMLKREKAAQELILPHGMCRVPKVYFEAEVDGLYVYAEEVINGLPLTRQELKRFEQEIVEFVGTFPIRDTIEAATLADVFERHLPRTDARANAFIGNLRQSGAVLQKGLTHGDLGTPNILKDGKGLVLIDWAHAGERPLALLDAVYVLTRLRRIAGVEDWQKRAAPLFMRYSGSSKSVATALYCAQVVFEVAKKKYPAAYTELSKPLS